MLCTHNVIYALTLTAALIRVDQGVTIMSIWLWWGLRIWWGGFVMMKYNDEAEEDDDWWCMGLNHWTEAPSWSTPLQVWPKYLTLFQLRLAIYLFSFLAALTLLTYLVKIYLLLETGWDDQSNKKHTFIYTSSGWHFLTHKGLLTSSFVRVPGAEGRADSLKKVNPNKFYCLKSFLCAVWANCTNCLCWKSICVLIINPLFSVVFPASPHIRFAGEEQRAGQPQLGDICLHGNIHLKVATLKKHCVKINFLSVWDGFPAIKQPHKSTGSHGSLEANGSQPVDLDFHFPSSSGQFCCINWESD